MVNCTEFRQFQTVETSCTGLLFHHARPQDFVRSQWICFTPICFTIYRVILAILLFIWMICDFTRETIKYFNYVGYTWVTYATNWAFIAFTLIHISLATYCLIYNIKYPNNKPKFYQPLWFMYNLSSTSIFVICVLFWFELSNSPLGPFNNGQIYPAIDWSTPQSTILVCLGGLIATILCHVILYTIYFVRVNVSAKFGGRGYMLIEESTERHGYDNHEFELGEDASKQEGKTSKIQNPKTEYQKYGTVE
ncbi:rolling stone-like [Schistosoma japonicum]|uniref:Rolling stone-like n=1 Tax=Schistosoma japonicum TaxID=6182 RepID=A0A4Z2DVC1_SCHJA|nr:Protein rolling stone [Schistosoma japonicum]TNN20486.1 rolling stone-like [Schistosoma japonicum]